MVNLVRVNLELPRYPGSGFQFQTNSIHLIRWSETRGPLQSSSILNCLNFVSGLNEHLSSYPSRLNDAWEISQKFLNVGIRQLQFVVRSIVPNGGQCRDLHHACFLVVACFVQRIIKVVEVGLSISGTHSSVSHVARKCSSRTERPKTPAAR